MSRPKKEKKIQETLTKENKKDENTDEFLANRRSKADNRAKGQEAHEALIMAKENTPNDSTVSIKPNRQEESIKKAKERMSKKALSLTKEDQEETSPDIKTTSPRKKKSKESHDESVVKTSSPKKSQKVLSEKDQKEGKEGKEKETSKVYTPQLKLDYCGPPYVYCIRQTAH